jgi:RimJ/RimL family protein N-acetyltransferase
MIHELEPKDFSKVIPLFRGHKRYLPVQAVVEGKYPGRVFVDDDAEPRTAMVWAIGRWAYIEGDADNEAFNLSLAEFVHRTIIPDSLRIKMNWFELYANSAPRWMQNLESCLGEFNLSKHTESTFVWDKRRYRSFRAQHSCPPEWMVKKAKIPILPARAREAALVPEEFRIATAVGFKLIVKDEVVAQCRSNGFTSGIEFMIDVETFKKDDREKGYATAASAALLDYCLKNRLVPLWETTEDNTASRRLAQKLGFVENEIYPVYAISF